MCYQMIKTINKLLIVLGIIISPYLSYSQEAEELISLYFKEVRDGKYPAIPKQLSINENAKNTLIALTLYLKDSIPSIRAKAYGLAQVAGSNARQSSVREDAVVKLVEAAKDQDSGNAGLALDYLTTFLREDFSDRAKDTLRMVFKRRQAHFDKVIRLVGFLQMNDLAVDLTPWTASGTPKQIRWAALLSLTRMKDEVAQQELLSRVRRFPVNDDVVYQVFPDLIFSRDRETIDYIITVMQSDAKNCTSADAERETSIPCGYRIMEQLAPIIKDFPVEMEEGGDIRTNDYLAALASVRYWFNKNKNYEILTDRY